jgi:hypothetical protein
VLRWNAAPGKSYVVESAPIGVNDFATVETIVSEGTSCEVQVAAGEAEVSGCYRVRLVN